MSLQQMKISPDYLSDKLRLSQLVLNNVLHYHFRQSYQ